ncbi:hypothetical protein WA026_023400 [Henosepilachna vigintioctopunctata]|uniref:Lipase n=1 Tax=Henosepilachna vigintioctopunctata TaxID=420089 RepID=A0AAW1UCM2_9CUCU
MVVTDNEVCASISEYMSDLVRSRGYPLEIHEVTTEDKYIVSIYRLPYGLVRIENEKPRQPVLLVHGLCSSAADALNVESQMGYFLADRGFDVWLANCRGTTFSRGHQEFDHVQQSDSYWNFSFHEIGYYDIAAFIDEVLSVTGFKKIFYIGISQGATAYAVLMSTRPEYNQRILLSCLLCPGIKFQNASLFPVKFCFKYLVPLVQVFTLDLYQEAPLMDWIRYFGRKYAKPNSIAEYFYIKLWDILSWPFKSRSVDYRKISITSPNTASNKQIKHFSQILRANKFAQFDVGPEENIKKYGCKSPPLYDLSKLTAPVGIFYSENDMFYGTEDIDWIADQLNNCVLKYLVQYEKFNHMNFIYNKEITSLLYEPILKLMNEYLS